MKLNRGRRTGKRGSAVLIVLVLLMIVEVMIICNNRVLDSLKRELQLLDHKQTEKFQVVPSGTSEKPAKP